MKFIISILTLTAALFITSCSSSPKEEPFSVNLNSPHIQIGSAEAYFDRTLSIGKMVKRNIEVYYYPVENAVCLQFKVQLVECKQFWDKAGREAFVNAFEQYKSDYEQRLLVRDKASRRAYGTVQGFFAWKRTRVGVQAHGHPKVELGYNLKEGAAFFSTTQLKSDYDDPLSNSRNQTSPVTKMHFTRAQAEELAALFDEGYLRSLAGGSAAPGNVPEVEELDGY